MAGTLRFDGMSEFRAALRRLPDELKAEASHIVEATANGVAAQVKQNYPTGKTGNLVRGVTVTHFEGGKVSAGAIVKSVAKHAWLYEHGSKVRRTGRGANRGQMPEAPESKQMIPIVVRARRRMTEQLIGLLQRNGFTVGD